MYEHRWINGQPIHLPVGKVVCVGRNYPAHTQELGNPSLDEPLLFMKPSTSISHLRQPIALPSGRGPVHYETEIAILIGSTLKQVSEQQAVDSIAGIGLGLDLTLRELQNSLKKQGHPWEKAKAFDDSCPLSEFVMPAIDEDWHSIPLRLTIDDNVRQDGHSEQMLYSIPALLCYISRHFTLLPGDVVLTGTPEGVGELTPSARLKLEIPGRLTVSTEVEQGNISGFMHSPP